MRFRVGDVCVIVASPDRPEHIGRECTVTAPERLYWPDIGDVQDKGYEIEAPWLPKLPRGSFWFAAEHELRLRKPPSYFLGTESHLTAEDKREDRQKERV